MTIVSPREPSVSKLRNILYPLLLERSSDSNYVQFKETINAKDYLLQNKDRKLARHIKLWIWGYKPYNIFNT